MRAHPRSTLLGCLLLLALGRGETDAQTRAPEERALDGSWIRIDSNYDPNDAMRVAVKGNRGMLSAVPTTAHRGFRIGQVLWRDVTSDGALQVRGSDGRYYGARLSFEGSDIVRIRIDYTAPGAAQTWRRAGPVIEGEWVRIAPPSTPDDGVKVRAEGGEARVRYLPPGASGRLRVGAQLWRNLSAGGSIEIVGSDGRYYDARLTVVDSTRLRIDSEAPRVVAGQIWVRPRLATEARRLLDDPRPERELDDAENPDGFELPDSLPRPSVACAASSLPLDPTGVSWGWNLTSRTRSDARAETLGLWEYFFASAPPPEAVPTDIERYPWDGFGLLWHSRGRRSAREASEEYRDLTSAEFDERADAADRAGLMPVDIEAWETPDGMRYAGIWSRNNDGIAWRVVRDRTSESFGAAFSDLRRSGYRLIDMEAYGTPDGLRYAGIWHRSCDNTDWVEWRDMDRARYLSRFDSLEGLGYRVIDFESYRTDGGQRYAAIWQRMPAGRAWIVRSDRTLDAFLNLHRQYVDEGLKLHDHEAYATENGARFAGIWVENDARYDYPLKALLDDSIKAYRDNHGIPGISVVVMQDEEVVYRRGFGWADSASQKAAHSGTIYLTASVAKAVAGTLAARLEEKGLVDLSRPTATYLDDLPDHHTHTVEQLLAKTGCVPHYAEGSEPDLDRTYAFRLPALEQMWGDSLLKNPPCTPGSHYRYSTHGFTYVGGVLEEVTGKPIGDIIAEELTRPFGLTSMGLVTTEQWGGYGGLGVRPFHLARGYDWNPPTTGATQAIDYDNTTWKVLGGGLQTNALDLARFGWLTSTGAIVADTARLWTPLTAGAVSWVDSISSIVPTGLGWILGAPANRRVAQHDGIAPGARSFLRVYRDDGLVIAVLSNQKQSPLSMAGDFRHPIGTLVSTVARIVFANPPPP